MKVLRSKRREVFFVYFRQWKNRFVLLLYQDAATLQPGYIGSFYNTWSLLIGKLGTITVYCEVSSNKF